MMKNSNLEDLLDDILDAMVIGLVGLLALALFPIWILP